MSGPSLWRPIGALAVGPLYYGGALEPEVGGGIMAGSCDGILVSGQVESFSSRLLPGLTMDLQVNGHIPT